MPGFLDGLEGASRLLMEAPLRPVQGSRSQPTGFPDLGAAVYRTDQGEELLVESAQSMANRLEQAVWDPATQTIVPALEGISYIRVLQDGDFLTNSVMESHRINSPYILEGEDAGFFDMLKEETNALAKRPVDLRLLARILMRYDCNCLLHGVFLAKKELAGGTQLVETLGAQTQTEYADWRDDAEAKALQTALDELRARAVAKGSDPAKAKLTPKQREKALEHLPDDAFAALHADTGDLRKQGWSRPPGSVRLMYAKPSDLLQVRPRAVRRATSFRPTVARFALAGPVLPLLTDTVYVGENTRQALMSWSDGAEVFSGRDASGEPLREGPHAHFLPADDDGDGRLDHITVFAACGLGPRAQDAIGGVRRLWQAGGRPDIHLVLVGLGDADDFGGLDPTLGQTPQLATATTWVSRTPLLLSRHPKLTRGGAPKLDEDGTWVDGPADQLVKELARRGFLTISGPPEPTFGTEAAGKPLRWLRFARHRRGGDYGPTSPRGHGFLLRFPEPVTGPVVAGYGAHFGLGQFVAVRDE